LPDPIRNEGRLQHGRRKLDPRLAYLAGLSLATLRKLQRDELRALAEVVQGIATVRKPRDDADDLQRFREERHRLKAKLFAPLTAGLASPGSQPPEPAEEPLFSVFISSEGSQSELAELGVGPRTRSAEVHTAFLPASRLAAVQDCPGIGFVELARPWFQHLDEAIPAAQINDLHAAHPAMDGSGVIIGIIDNAIDFHHADFRKSDGSTRLLHLWDQTLAPVAGEGGPPVAPALPGFMPQGQTSYGVEYDAAALDRELAASASPGALAYRIVRHAPALLPQDADRNHGTSVAGCAAGNGRSNGRVGAAPGSSLIFVSPLGYDAGAGLVADNVAVLDGCAYIFARAAQARKPCVINISMGDNQGPHDGTTQGERFLDNLLALPGRAITLSAGNATNTRAHASGQIVQGAHAVLELEYQPGATNSDAVEIWYDGPDRLLVRVVPPSGSPVIGPLQPGTREAQVPVGNGVTVTVDSVLQDPRNRDNCISIIIAVPSGAEVPPGSWRIELIGASVVNGTFHAWLDRNNRGRCGWQNFLDDGQLTVGVPASARRPITVGNHTKSVPPLAGLQTGRGPTRDGRTKPEIAAVGTRVSAPAAQDRNGPLGQPPFVDVSGTSISAPIVAGACALLFQHRGMVATCAELKHLLTEAAGNAGIGAVPHHALGFGYLQARTAMELPDPSVDVWLRKDEEDTGDEPFTGGGVASSPDIEILDSDGIAAADPRHDPGARFSAVVRVTARNRGAHAARNVTVYLYWADPATDEAFPAAWKQCGIYTRPPGSIVESNRVVLPVLGPGAAQPVPFAWAPPDPVGSRHGDGRFRLLARVKHELDAAKLPADEAAAAASNNLALLDVRVRR
jgi:hypothetical protein